MNILGKLQNQYDQLWKYIIRPSRTPYSQDSLGPNIFKLQNQQVRRQDYQITNSRGYVFTCSLWYPTQHQNFSCIIYLHGNSGNRTQGMEYLGKFIKNGIALCTFDFSGCGNADGQYVTLGYFQQEDLRLVVEYLKQNPRIKDLAVWGRSMGAVTALLYLGKTIQIKAVVLDSPFKSLKSFVEDTVKKNSKLPGFVLTGALKIIAKTIQDRAKFSIYNINPLKYSVPGLYCPAFFIVAIDDEIIPNEHTKQLYAAYGGEDKQIRLVKGKHADPRPDDIVNEVLVFLQEKFKVYQKTDNEKIKKQFDFFQAQIQQEKQKDKQKQEVENVDFFAIGNTEEVKKVEQQIKKGQFSLSGLFSVFSKDSKKKQKQKEAEKQRKDGYEETRNILIKKYKQQETNFTILNRIQKKQKEDNMKKQYLHSGSSNNDQIRQWIFTKQ